MPPSACAKGQSSGSPLATPAEAQASAPSDTAAGSPPRHALEGLATLNPMLPEAMARNISRIEELSQRLIAALAQRQPQSAGVQGPGPDLYQAAAQGWMKAMTEQPARLIQAQTSYWAETLRLYASAQADLAAGRVAQADDDAPKDPRFRNPLWTTNPFFSLVRRQYQINAAAISKAAAEVQPDDPTARRRIDWFTRQMIDMMAPTNFLATNPDALQRAVETEGESLVRGLENLVADIERNGGEVVVSLVDRDAFTVGENIATSEGTVVFRHPLFELIQYAPTTDQVHETPLILFPPWINKFYILDLKPQNSLIRWLVGQGYTLFVISWRNPEVRRDADVGMDDYVSAYLTAMDEVLERTGQPKLNAVGYCIGGTTLALTLALLRSRGDQRVGAATFFTTLTDFSETGEFTTFLQDDFLGGIDEEVARTGVLGAQLMSRTFSFLRANDLVWAPAIRAYMLGETPPAFDLLYWNADATNLPGKMAREYLRGLCQSNGFAQGGFTVLGQKVRLSDVDLPICAIACENDHIAPWLDCWRGFSMTGAQDRTFILSQSGHIAGIVNPPGRIKYGHYTSGAGFGGSAQTWRDAARFLEGSWWPTWGEWLAPRSGGMVAARDPGEGLAPAPGTYVHQPA
ncbi:class I poly(R)-hydroxyalkanoic acid synthase [Paracoccus suum]|uniref:Class I poly(R)-hydroxyalkanoic acid synthase n=2 Tax=Paracoccus suum TaxID=2259340 RepID=A0A344PPC5_9RHOB|nr:class I poly(R)-hydroxyalkanoic acid synthase [Paracoccus suum]